MRPTRVTVLFDCDGSSKRASAWIVSGRVDWNTQHRVASACLGRLGRWTRSVLALGGSGYRVGRGPDHQREVCGQKACRENSEAGNRTHTAYMNADISPRTANPHGSLVTGTAGPRTSHPIASIPRGLPFLAPRTLALSTPVGARGRIPQRSVSLAFESALSVSQTVGRDRCLRRMHEEPPSLTPPTGIKTLETLVNFAIGTVRDGRPLPTQCSGPPRAWWRRWQRLPQGRGWCLPEPPPHLRHRPCCPRNNGKSQLPGRHRWVHGHPSTSDGGPG